MTENKPIIIDGVDVSGCEHYTGNIVYLTDTNWTCRAKIQGTKCEDWSDCYFKRWQRKEQECEELKKYLNQIRDEELSHLDIEWDEYETSARQVDYSNIITLVERALGEIDD